MMKQLRDSTKIIMIVVVIAFVGLMFFQWGMDLTGNYGSGSTGSSIGNVNGAPVTLEDYQRQYQILYDQAQRDASDSGLSAEDVDVIERQAWDDVVNLTLLRKEAQDRDIRLTDRELIEFIRSNPPTELLNSPGLQTDGRFDLIKYQEALTDPSLSQVWAGYEEQLRLTLPVQKLQEQVIAGAFVTEAEIRQEYADRNERARITYVYLDPGILIDEGAVQISDEQIERYYQEHREAYRREASAKVRYVAFEPPITAADSAAARSLADSIATLAGAADADFAALAREFSDDAVTADNGGELGWFDPATMAPAFAEAVRGADSGSLVGPVLTPFGWHVIGVGEKQTDLVRAHHILIAVEPADGSRDAARDAARAFAREASGEGDDAFGAAAEAGALPVAEPPIFERSVVIPGLGAARAMTDFIFNNDAGAISGALERGDTYYVVRVDERYPAGFVARDQVAGEIGTELVRLGRIEAVRARTGEITDAVRQAGLEGAAERLGLTAQTTGSFTRTNNIPGIGSGTAVAGAAFGLGQGETAGPIETNRGLYYLRLIEKQSFDERAYERDKAALRDRLRNAKAQASFNAWFEALRAEADVDDRRSLVLGTT